MKAWNAFSEDSITKAAYITVNPNSITTSALSNEPVRIYPTKSKGNINIVIDNISQDANCVVYDLTGREIIQKSLQDNFSILNISTLTNGIYLMKIKNAGNSYIKKIIKE